MKVPCLVLLALFRPSSAAADVLVVGPQGAPFSTLQAAVDAASDGDVVLVRSGTYAGCSVVGKSVALVADPQHGVALSTPLTVQNLDPLDEVTVAGFAVRPTFGGGIRLLNNQGAVRLAGLMSLPSSGQDSFLNVVEVLASIDVAVLGCQLTGGSSTGSFPSLPGSGLSIVDSVVALFDSVLIGGRGSDAQYVGAGGSSVPALPGAAACTIDGASELHCAGSLCIGGAGGRGLGGICAPFVSNGGQGASGGPGLLNQAAALVRVQDTVLQGGAGGAGGLGGSPCGTAAGPMGAPGAPSVGSVQLLPGIARRLRTPNQVREQSSLPLEVVALPGEQVYLQLGGDTQWTYSPSLAGVRLVGSSSRRLFLGTVPSSGVLVTALPIPDLGAGVEALWNHLQIFAIDSAGAIQIGGGQELVALDSAF